MDSGGWLGRVEARHSEARACEPADLEGHCLGETKAAREELLHTIQELEEEAGQPRPHGASSEAPRELVFQRGGHEGLPGIRGDYSSRTQHQVDLLEDEDSDAEEVEAGRPRPHEASGEAPRELVPQGGKREGSPGAGSGGFSRAQRQADLSWIADAAVSKKRRLPSGSEGANKAKRKPAQCPSCEARTH
jgi:hypothetical protein